MERVDFSDFKKEALKDAEVREEYEKLKPNYELRKQLIALRKEAGLTQEDLAEKLHTKKSNISRLESANSKSSPRLSTIEEYAHAMGYEVKIDFIPRVQKR
jgi:transcriptional regulator with XRE-family HTH domain